MSGSAARVVTVSFPPLGRQADYAVESGGSVPTPGSLVVVEGFRGLALGRLIQGPHEPGGKAGRVRRFVREAQDDDVAAQAEFEAREHGVLRRALGWVRDKQRPWKIVRVVGDGVAQKFTICFAARERQDCKEDAAVLGRLLGCRIELRQLGQRDTARSLGGLGRCGRELCCSSFLPEYPTSTIRMAKDQSISLAGDKTAGVCGKTLCCLSYESDFYKTQLQWLPRMSKRARTTDGLEGRVIGLDVFRLTFTLLDGHRRRHVLPAAAWAGNEGRELPEPEICAPASAPAVVKLGAPRAAPNQPATPPQDKPVKSRTGRNRRRRGKKDPT
jgi:cell fate regulator YaaT (PSP1 superfamily)